MPFERALIGKRVNELVTRHTYVSMPLRAGVDRKSLTSNYKDISGHRFHALRAGVDRKDPHSALLTCSRVSMPFERALIGKRRELPALANMRPFLCPSGGR